MAIGIRKFNERSFIDLVPMPLFGELLMQERWRDKLPASLDPTDLTPERLFAFLVDGNGVRPPALIEALHRMNDVLSQDCYERIVDVAEAAGVLTALLDGSGQLPALHELVMRAFLYARAEVFDRVWDQEFLQTLSFPYDRLALERPRIDVTDEKLEAFRAALRPVLEEQHQGNYCAVKYYREEHEDVSDVEFGEEEVGADHYFIIRHGWRPIRETVVDGDREDVLAFRPARQSVVHYNDATGKVRLHTASRKVEEKEALRDLFAEHILGNVTLFRHENADKLYTLEPIHREGTEFEFAAGLGPDDRVAVTEVKVSRGAGKKYVANTVQSKEDALAEIAEGYEKIDLQRDDILHVKLQFRLQVGGSLVRKTVLIRPPSVCSFKDAAHGETVWRLLEQNGFLLRKPAE